MQCGGVLHVYIAGFSADTRTKSGQATADEDGEISLRASMCAAETAEQKKTEIEEAQNIHVHV